MKFRVRYVALFTILLIQQIASAGLLNEPGISGVALKHKAPLCIGEFCFGKDLRHLLTEHDLVKRYGKGHTANGKFSAYCYKVAEQELFVRFRPYHGENRFIADIFVSDVANCPATKLPKVRFNQLTTAEGLRIGDSYEKVLSIYGEPDSVAAASGIEKTGLNYKEALASTPFGDKYLVYWPDKEASLHAHIYIRNGKVSAILISVSP